MAPAARSVMQAFGDEVLRAFGFLADFGFRVDEKSDAAVHFVSTDVFVSVLYDRYSFDVSFELGLLTHPNEKYFPGDVMLATSGGQYLGMQASTPAAVRTCLGRLAQLLIGNKDLLRGDRFAFKRVRDAQLRSSDALLEKWHLQDARAAAREAWRRKDFAKVVQVFAPIEDHLSDAERRKLDYARRHR